MSDPRLHISGVTKSFGATQALRGVDLDVAPGEVMALIGENGAGKSTLMKVLSGAHRPDKGCIELEGRPYLPSNPLDARRQGVAMIYQELNLAPHLSIEENIMLGVEPSRWGWLNLARRRSLARQALADLCHEGLPLDAPAGTRPIAEQQLVEIARALLAEPRVLILDEPTSSLTRMDIENLFRVIHRLRDRGVSIIYISHFLEECQRVADRFTVLRDGQTVGSGLMREAPISGIIKWMVGREIADIYPRQPHPMGKPVFELRALSGRAKPQNASLTLHEGEILGVAGLIGAGRTEMLRACFGLDPLAGGFVLLDQQAMGRPRPSVSLARGVGLLSENRKEEGLMLNRTVAENLLATRWEPFSRFGLIGSQRQDAAARTWMERLAIRARGPSQSIGALSGGNQQKVALGRLLHHEARVLLLDEPTRGIDVGSKAQIYKLITQLAAQGKAIIFVSSYLPELLGVCDTIAVMCRGGLGDVRPATAWTEQTIMQAAIGQNAE